MNESTALPMIRYIKYTDYTDNFVLLSVLFYFVRDLVHIASVHGVAHGVSLLIIVVVTVALPTS